jgi:gamma-glutamylaminecyclotransferase
MERHNIFVYGTLRTGGYWNQLLLPESHLISAAKTKEKYALYSDGIPYVVKGEAVIQIVGEVWDVDTPTLRRIDILEQHPAWYNRETITVVSTHGEEIRAWIYFNRKPAGALVEGGDFFNR